MKTAKRRCIVDTIDEGPRVKDWEGTFHQFATIFDTGRSQTMAIVEDRNGKVHIVSPANIRFLDR